MIPIQVADHEAINAEAEAIADEFHRLMSTSTYKGKNIFVDTAGGEYVSMGGRDAEMTFGIGTVEIPGNVYSSIHRVQDELDDELGLLPTSIKTDQIQIQLIYGHNRSVNY